MSDLILGGDAGVDVLSAPAKPYDAPVKPRDFVQRPHLGQLNLGAQGPYPRVLFVCSGGMLRSATAAHWAAEHKKWNTRSCGTMGQALPPVHQNLVEWAQRIYCMAYEHADVIEGYYPWARYKIVVLEIPDWYEYRDPKLIKILEQKLGGLMLSTDS
jgi:predicted protein tyrosine phosphatase